MANVQITGLSELLRNMDAVAKQQAPFAIARAMTATVRRAGDAETAHIAAVFDRPTPFTRRAIGTTAATKNNLVASVFVKDAQTAYLFPQAEGGARGFKTFEEKFASGGVTKVALPGRGVALNQYGNVSKARIKRIARDLNIAGTAKRFFSGRPRGQDLPAGIYARVNNNKLIVPLLVFADAAIYRKRFQFSEIGMATITAEFEKNMVAAWELAMSTARR